jgi:TetR/AcrR family transcriptional regulator, biofilm operon repressor
LQVILLDTQAKFDTLIAQAASTKDKLFYAGLRLFAQKGYSNVGIRELCRMVGIKESSFYNHYPGKESLFAAILAYFERASVQAVMNDAEIHAMIEQGDVRAFFLDNMRRFSAIASNVLYHAALQIVLAESFLHPGAAEIAKRNLYYLRRDCTEQVLRGLMEKNAIRPCNAEAVTAEYCYALKGMLDEHLLLQLWNADLSAINARINAHIDFYSTLLAVAHDDPGQT